MYSSTKKIISSQNMNGRRRVRGLAAGALAATRERRAGSEAAFVRAFTVGFLGESSGRRHAGLKFSRSAIPGPISRCSAVGLDPTQSNVRKVQHHTARTDEYC